MNIKKRLPLTIAGLVAIPLVILNIVLYSLASSAMMGSAQGYLDGIAGIEAKQIRSLIFQENKRIKHAAHVPIMNECLKGTEATTKLWQTWLAGFRDTAESDRRYFLLDDKGRVVENDSSAVDNQNFSNYPFFISLSQQRTTVSQVFRFAHNSEAVIALSAEIVGNAGLVSGYLVELIPIDRLAYLTRTISLGNTGYGYLLDSNGIIISHPDPSRSGKMTENDFMLRQLDLDKKNPSRVGTDVSAYQNYFYRGEWKYMGLRRVPQTGWYLVITQTVTEIQGPVFFILAWSLGTLFLMVGSSLFLTIHFSRFITTPINLIHDTVEEIGKGNLGVRCAYSAQNELGELASHVNQMAQQLSESRVTIQERDHALLNSEIRYRQAVDGSNDAVYEWETGRGLIYISSKYEELVGLRHTTPAEMHRDFLAAVDPEDLSELQEAVRTHINDDRPYFRHEIRLRDQHGQFRWLLIRGKAHRYDAGSALRLAGSITNITDRRIKEERIHSLAFSDQLTGLPNRQSYMDLAPAVFAEYAHTSKQSGLALLDIDDFRKINDALGHAFGDQILIQIARQLQAVAGSGQVYRFGGDEFIVVFPGMDDLTDLDSYTIMFQECLQSGIQILGKSFFLTMTIGVCLFPQDAQEAQEMLRKADTAMYAAKQKGKRTLSFYNQGMYDGLSQRIHLEAVLRQAIRDDQLVMYYQPLVAMADLSLTGFEALMRMPDPLGDGFISPDKFIPIAEESGLIHQMGYWIFSEVCLQIRKWDKLQYHFQYISLNVSALQFHDPNFAERLYAIVREFGIDPPRIQIEITETALMESRESVTEALDQIRSWGFRIALDDFGTGYSSLGYLKTIPITTLKMDKTFIHDIAAFPKHEAIADGIIQMAKNMGLEVIAEGIETTQQFEMLANKGCTIAQGYLFSKPLPPEDLTQVFTQGFSGVLNN